VRIITVFPHITWTNAVTPDMALKENIGSDRSWVYTTTADVSEGVPTVETLAIRFGNSESTISEVFVLIVDAKLFKEHFEKAQQENIRAFSKTS
jgi:Ran-binding protein 1